MIEEQKNPFDEYLQIEISFIFKGEKHLCSCYITPEMLKDTGVNESLQFWFNKTKSKVANKILELL